MAEQKQPNKEICFHAYRLYTCFWFGVQRHFDWWPLPVSDFRLLLGMWQKRNVNVFNFFISNHSSYSYLLQFTFNLYFWHTYNFSLSCCFIPPVCMHLFFLLCAYIKQGIISGLHLLHYCTDNLEHYCRVLKLALLFQNRALSSTKTHRLYCLSINK